MQHITVLQQEAVEGLALRASSVVVDATFGAGGHSRLIGKTLGPDGLLIAIDADPTAFPSQKDISAISRARVISEVANFADIKAILARNNVNEANAILADLGWRTDQFETEGRGFSFHDDVSLDMTFGKPDTYHFTAHDIVNGWDEETLANIIFGYGEERYARKIARAITVARNSKSIATAKELAAIISGALPAVRHKRWMHPATKTFQALRITVNDELQVLETFIRDAFESLATAGRLAIISFHSLEDRIVKHSFRSFSHDQAATVVTKKPIVPTTEEIINNPRARSAKLRIIKKL